MNKYKIAIIIKTYNRPLKLMSTVESIRRYCVEDYKIYIADDGEVTPEIARLYEELIEAGHEIIIYENHVNVTVARNEMIRRLNNEEFILRIDDDFNFCEETNIKSMISIMRARPEIGALSDLERQIGEGKGISSGEISAKQGYMILANGVLHKLTVPHTDWVYLTAAGVRFAYANFTRNFLLIRREVFSTVKWNESIVIQGEHTAFMLDLQKAGWALAFTPDSIHLHNETETGNQGNYKEIRQSDIGRQRQQDVFLSDYGIKSMRGVSVSAVLDSYILRKFGAALNRLKTLGFRR